ncbi:GNAT family N-acetyltransferase [Eilatimonas milleporae]|uniref:Ribosomal protein S18 acetylase RimI-like enzyme n=1 Tax=Eilatimonas milleporae TaxID=911205 RepID=A0A3M0CTD2_9PROT|nr:GNAT family N-acetyltransferase [Eilatimonas milleporae]RMB12205.1 ribosomal protein S18 acetylase RimI-like enzyme [Eilatimonas milleporae]
MTDIAITDVAEGDVGAIVDLIRALAAHEGRPDAATVGAEALTDLLFGPLAIAHGLIARRVGAPVGYALFGVKFASFTGARLLYIDDIFVHQNVRGHGLGTGFMAALAREAVRRGCAAMEWSALDDNDQALGFYDRLGAIEKTGIRYFRTDGADLSRLADAAMHFQEQGG